MSSLRTSVLAAASALVALYAVACAAPVAQKTMVVDCDKSSDDPTCQESTSKKSGSKSSSSSSSEEETSSASPSQPETAPSASSSASAAPTGSGSATPPGLGFYCAKLDGCCKALDVMGINGSATLCRDVVSTKNETSCNFAFRDYGKPVINDDGVQTYTPPPACL